MRPRLIDEILGQPELVGPSGFIRRFQAGGPAGAGPGGSGGRGAGSGGQIPSLILHGPPGTGKTTLGRLLARYTGAEFVPFNAVSEGVPRLREIVKTAREWRRAGRRTLLFVDEIHRLNKGQQDFLLPFVESGMLTLVGATTEHPGFEVNAALLSRSRVLRLNTIDGDALREIVRRALTDAERGLGGSGVTLTPEAETLIVESSGGDARRALNALEIAAELARASAALSAGSGVGPGDGPGDTGQGAGQAAGESAGEGAGELRTGAGAGGVIDVEIAAEALQRPVSAYGATVGYEMLSAFHKSLRSSQGDAALYWAMRMVRGGEDPLVLFRRLIAASYEDVGLADPNAGVVATQAMQAFERMGPPEGFLPLANAILYVANAPKSNRTYMALAAAREAAEKSPDAPVPLHLRNATTSLMRDWGYGKEYRYAHDYEGGYTDLNCLPDELDGARFYEPTDRGHEAEILRMMRERGQAG
jgi:putative ATPase